MTHPSLAEIRAVNKGRPDQGFMLRTARPLAPWLAWIFLRIGIRPLHVSLFNFVFGMGTCVLLATGGAQSRMIAAVLLVAWQLLDVTDGTMARVLGIRSNFGGFVDHLGGLYLLAFIMFASSVGLATTPEHSVKLPFLGVPWSGSARGMFFVAVGGFSSIAAVLMRLTNRTVELRFPGKTLVDDLAVRRGILTRGVALARDLENIGGFMLPALLIAALSTRMEWFVLGYASLYVAMLVLSTAKTLIGLRNEHEYPDGYGKS